MATYENIYRCVCINRVVYTQIFFYPQLKKSGLFGEMADSWTGAGNNKMSLAHFIVPPKIKKQCSNKLTRMRTQGYRSQMKEIPLAKAEII